MSTKRLTSLAVLAIAGLGLMPQAASALSFQPSAASPITIPSPNDQVNDAATADLDGNGNDDIVSVGNSMGVYVFLANNEGTGFTQAPGSPFGTGSAGNGRISVFTGQFGGDSATDLLVMNDTYPRTFDTFLGHGDGTFATDPDFTYTAPQPGPNTRP
ncbi:MAG: VCBS repeat-containing protein [Solirubrobacterales bacterium]|nr:VCBS repeat-containing protein [Solirubrobacterales bacterium]